MRRAIARGRNVTVTPRYMRYMVQKIAPKKGIKMAILKLNCNSYVTVTLYI